MLGLGPVSPAHSAGGPPTITSLSPDPVAINGTVTVVGSGCDAASPVSFRLWDPTGGSDDVMEVHSSDSGAVANGSGAFTHGVALAGFFPPGVEVGVVASCTPTFDESQMSNAPDDGSYVLVELPAPAVDLTVVAQALLGSRPVVTVTTTDAPGSLFVRLDGTDIYSSSTGHQTHSVLLPASLPLGTHTLSAEFDPFSGGAPTVTDTATVAVVTTSAVALSRSNRKKIEIGKKVRLTVVLSSAGPLVGEVVIKDGRRTRRTITVQASDNGTRTFKVKMLKKGKRKLTAHFAGGTYVLASISKKLTIKVVK